MSKTINEINEKIKKGAVRVVRADEMTRIVKKLGPERAAEEVDVVTTGTFGAMCSSGAWLNFGHSEPPIKMTRVWLNDVEAYTGVAAVDAFIGATQVSEKYGLDYGGAHVIEDLLRGKPVVLRSVSYGTDCYPRKRIITEVRLEDLNTALLSNPRNGYQKYNAASNSTGRTKFTYMGKLLPSFGNVTYSGSGDLSPLSNDPEYRTIGTGTRVFIGGAQGYVTGPGTQHNPRSGFGTLAIQGDLKKMSAKYIRAATFSGYGCTLYVGLGIPIPVLDTDVAARTGVADSDIVTEIIDYGSPHRDRPSLRKVTYAELKSGEVELAGKKVRTSPLSSFQKAKEIAEALKGWIAKGGFKLSEPVDTLPRQAVVRPLEIRSNGAPGGGAPEIPAVPKGSRLGFDSDRCISCGQCLSLCPRAVFTRDKDWRVGADRSLCDACGLCADACPVKAINVKGGRP